MSRLAGALLAAVLAAAQEAKVPEKVDLLQGLDFKKDAVLGKWAFEEKVLVAPTVRFGRLQIPYQPPEEYDVRLVAERKAGTDSIVLGLVGKGRQFAVVIDAFAKDPFSGVDRVDGKAFPDNETKHAGRVVENGKKVEIRASVRKDRLTITLDGKPLVDWKADWSRVSLFEDWEVPDKGALFLGSWTAPWHVHALELTPVTGEGRRTR